MEISDKDTQNQRLLYLEINGTKLNLASPAVMGILNISHDSFYDGGNFSTEKAMLNQFEKMVKEGAAIIDIGAVSTRPGADEIVKEEELARFLKALRWIKPKFPETIISVDTYRSSIAEAAINEGAHIINDISGGTFDNQMFETVGRLRVPYIMMHIKGTPKNMQVNPVYTNVIEEIDAFFKKQLTKLEKSGKSTNIILDPGFGFGKTVDHNYEILRHLNLFKESGFPLLAGISRKSMINKVLHKKPDEALNGTTVLNTLALLNGANILRVHDVKEAMEVVKLVEFYKKTVEN